MTLVYVPKLVLKLSELKISHPCNKETQFEDYFGEEKKFISIFFMFGMAKLFCSTVKKYKFSK